MMRTLLVLSCYLSLAYLAGAAQQQQQQENNTANPQGKKKGQNVQATQHVTKGPSSKRSFSTTGQTGAGTGKTGQVNSNTQLQTHHNVSKTPLGTTGQTQTNVSGGGPKMSSQTNVAGQANVSGQANVQKFHAKHFNLSNQPNPAIQTVNFKAGAHIQGSQNWHGTKYVVFRNYAPVWHDQFWWTSHHTHIVFVFGGWYYWNAGYWYPAWGYAPTAYYAFHGPIYAGSVEMDPGQVVANVQAALQAQSYYHGEIDGILGPQTRAALADYQVAQGMEPTGAVDEPTLESLGMA
jgi:hypothetical protein